MARQYMGEIAAIALAVLLVITTRGLFWKSREDKRRRQGHRPRQFAVWGLGRVKRNSEKLERRSEAGSHSGAQNRR